MNGSGDVEGLLRQLAPRALGVAVRRYGPFADAEDAVQEALGPVPALAVVDELAGAPALAHSHRLHAVRAHLLQMQGGEAAARDQYVEAAAGTGDRRERAYLTLEAAMRNATP